MSYTDFLTETKKRGKVQKEVTIGLKEARNIERSISWGDMRIIAEETQKYLPDVLQEIASLRKAKENHPERMRQRAFLFGIATPNRDEAQSIGWALEADKHYAYLSPYALCRKSYISLVSGNRSNIGFYNSLESSLFHASLNGGLCERSVEGLEDFPGIGPKVARMITAVCNPDADVWTVDIWHLRQLLWSSGREYKVRAGCSNQAYVVLEGIWLAYAHRFFPDTPVWAVQWATWCAANGHFVSHASLWRDLVS